MRRIILVMVVLFFSSASVVLADWRDFAAGVVVGEILRPQPPQYYGPPPIQNHPGCVQGFVPVYDGAGRPYCAPAGGRGQHYGGSPYGRHFSREEGCPRTPPPGVLPDCLAGGGRGVAVVPDR